MTIKRKGDKMNLKSVLIIFLALNLFSFTNCKDATVTPVPVDPNPSGFYFGADLSYVNQILDHDGVYKDQNVIKNPYKIFKGQWHQSGSPQTMV